MTNVPQNIRNACTDVYVLFDKSYLMDGSVQAWKEYWDKANELIQKYGEEVPLLELLEDIAHMLEIFIARRQTKNESLYWGRGEPYPYPKDN